METTETKTQRKKNCVIYLESRKIDFFSLRIFSTYSYFLAELTPKPKQIAKQYATNENERKTRKNQLQFFSAFFTLMWKKPKHNQYKVKSCNLRIHEINVWMCNDCVYNIAFKWLASTNSAASTHCQCHQVILPHIVYALACCCRSCVSFCFFHVFSLFSFSFGAF